jgi:deferrochelatase/peroxidase EfeB
MCCPRSGRQARLHDPSFDIVTGTTASTFIDLMRNLTDRARFLTSGGTPPIVGIGQPPSDSDVLGSGSRPTV